MPDIMSHIGEGGTFAETFKAEAIAIAGEGFADSKVFDDVPDVTTLVKNYAHTKTAFGKKLDGVIQIPKDDASDEDKAAFQADLLTRAGASEKSEDYVVPEIEGVQQNEEFVNAMKAYAVESKMPVAMFNAFAGKYQEAQLAATKASLKDQQVQHETEFAELDKNPAWSGDKMVENGRIVFQAIMKFGTEDLQSLVKDAKLNDDPGNHQKWLDAGFDVKQRQILLNIGNALLSPEVPENQETDESNQNKGGERPIVGKDGIYNHPTSVANLQPKK